MAGGYSATTINDVKNAVGMSTGDILFCNDTRFFYRYDSASTETEKLPWVINSNTAGCWLVTGNHERVVTLNDSNSIIPDYTLSRNFAIVMDANRASRLISTPTGMIDGLPINIIFKQPPVPPVGGCQITLSAAWVIVKNNILLSPTPNGYSLLQGIYYEADSKILGNVTPITP